MKLTQEGLVEAIRLELRKGSYQMPGDVLPYETQARSIAAALEVSGYIDIREAEKRRRYAALAEIEELGSDDMPYTKLNRK